jgi:hypothetical protein
MMEHNSMSKEGFASFGRILFGRQALGQLSIKVSHDTQYDNTESKDVQDNNRKMLQSG